MLMRCVIVAAFLAAPLVMSAQAHATDRIAVTIAPDDSEIVTTDMKRIWPAQPVELRFKIAAPAIAQTFGNDPALAQTRIRLTVIATARRVLGAMTGAQATGPEGAAAVVHEVDRALAGLGVTVDQFDLRYAFVPSYTPQALPPSRR